MHIDDLMTGDLIGFGSGFDGELLGSIEIATGGGFGHVGVVVGKAFVESSGNVHALPLDYACMGAVSVSRPRDFTRDAALLLKREAARMLDVNRRTGGTGYLYNHRLLRTPDRYYCSELVEHLFEAACFGLEAPLMTPGELRDGMRLHERLHGTRPGFLEEMLWGPAGLFNEFDPVEDNMDRRELVSPHAVMTAPRMEPLFEGLLDGADRLDRAVAWTADGANWMATYGRKA